MSELPSDEKAPVARPDSETRTRQKVILWTAAAVVILFWDDILNLALHALHILLEYVELATEEAIIHTFHVEEHEGQMYTAWLGLAAFLILSYWAYTAIRRKLKSKFRSWAYFRSWVKIHSKEHWLSLVLIITLYLAYLFLL